MTVEEDCAYYVVVLADCWVVGGCISCWDGGCYADDEVLEFDVASFDC